MQKLKSDMAKEKAKDGVNPIMIVKPSESCQGKGIFFINDLQLQELDRKLKALRN